MDYSWVSYKDMCDATKVLLTKDGSRLERQGERVKLLDKLFKTRFLEYCYWKTAEEAKQEVVARRQKRKRGEKSDEGKAKKARSWSDIDESSTDSSSESESEYSSYSSDSDSDNSDEDERKEKDGDEAQSASKTSTDAESTSEIRSSITGNTNSIDIENKENNRILAKDKEDSGIDKETSFYYDADAEAELDELLDF